MRTQTQQRIPAIQAYPFNSQFPACVPDICQTNEFDSCLQAQKAAYDFFKSQGAMSPRTFQTADAKRVNRLRINATGTYAVPNAITTGHVVLTYTVPKSYWAYIEQVVYGFISSGANTYANGSGQLTWHLGVNQWYQYDYGVITLDQGVISPGIPSPSLQSGIGINLYENDVARLIVDVNSATIGSGTLVAAFQGYMEPLR